MIGASNNKDNFDFFLRIAQSPSFFMQSFLHQADITPAEHPLIACIPQDNSPKPLLHRVCNLG